MNNHKITSIYRLATFGSVGLVAIVLPILLMLYFGSKHEAAVSAAAPFKTEQKMTLDDLRGDVSGPTAATVSVAAPALDTNRASELRGLVFGVPENMMRNDIRGGIYYITIPGVAGVAQVWRVQAQDRLHALASIGATVWSEKEWTNSAISSLLPDSQIIDRVPK